jgi:hypothetical protein
MRKWLFGQSLSARCTRSALLTAIPLVTANGALSLDLEVWKMVAVVAASAFLTPFAAALAIADEPPYDADSDA